MIKRPTSFDDYIGNKGKVDLLIDRAKRGTLPSNVMILGPSGIGKTTLVKLLPSILQCESKDLRPCNECETCKSIKKNLIEKNKDTCNVFTYKIPEEGSKETCLEIIKNAMTPSITNYKNKIIILEEVHKLSKNAQESFLIDLEYLPKNVYFFATTTDSSKLIDTFKGRFSKTYLKPPGKDELLSLLMKYSRDNKIKLPNGPAPLQILLERHLCRTRDCLKDMEWFDGDSLSMKDINELLGIEGLDSYIKFLKLVGSRQIKAIRFINGLQDDGVILQDYVTDLLDVIIDIISIDEKVTFVKYSKEQSEILEDLGKHIGMENLENLYSEFCTIDLKVSDRNIKHQLLNIMFKHCSSKNSFVKTIEEPEKKYENVAIHSESFKDTEMLSKEEKLDRVKNKMQFKRVKKE